MSVQKSSDGWTAIVDGRQIGTFKTSREAWRAFDIASQEVTSRAEELAEWVSRRS